MHWKGQYTVAINATSQQQKGKEMEMEKEDKTAQEKKIQHMVNDLIKMAERKGATYYGSWIEDGRQYFAGTHFCVCLNKPVELPERDGSYVKNQIYDYMKNAQIMNEKETALPDELNQMVKTLKKERGRYRSKRFFCFLGDREAAVNAEYLLMLSLVTGAKSVYLSEKRPEESIIYGAGENGMFIVLPVSFTEEDQKNFWME